MENIYVVLVELVGGLLVTLSIYFLNKCKNKIFKFIPTVLLLTIWLYLLFNTSYTLEDYELFGAVDISNIFESMFTLSAPVLGLIIGINIRKNKKDMK